jgi:hypothetical protein
MKRLDEIFSQSQKDIGDEEFQRIQRQEWYDFAERVLWDISSFTRSFLSSLDYDVPTGIMGRSILTIDGELKPYKILKVIRYMFRQGEGLTDGQECREHSNQALDNAMRHEVAFPVNRTELGGLSYAVARSQDQSMTLHLIHGSPKIPVHWKHNNDILVPDYMHDSVRFGLTMKALERLQFQVSNNEYMNRYAKAEQMYNKVLLKLKAYLVNLKDENSYAQGQPMVWLPEYS